MSITHVDSSVKVLGKREFFFASTTVLLTMFVTVTFISSLSLLCLRSPQKDGRYQFIFSRKVTDLVGRLVSSWSPGIERSTSRSSVTLISFGGPCVFKLAENFCSLQELCFLIQEQTANTTAIFGYMVPLRKCTFQGV